MKDISRRDFLRITTAAGGAVAFAGCTPFPTASEFRVQSTANLPEDMATGLDNWYASICRECRAGCGIIVRVFEGRAIKIEGNPEYPINRGALCARGQNAVQALYHPDRLREPMRRAGDRGSGNFEPISWDTAMEELVKRLRDIAAGSRGKLLLVTEPAAGHRALVLERFAGALNGQYLAFETLPSAVISTAVRRVFAQDQLPHFDIARSQYLLSFGADFLGTWLSPVQYNRLYGEFRQGRPNRGYFVQVEPRLSQTAANADEWLPIRPGTEGRLALSIAQVLVAEAKADQDGAQALLASAGANSLEAYAPSRVASSIGIDPDRIVSVARDFASQRPALAIGGDQPAAHANGLFNMSAIFALNVLAGNVGKPGGVLFNPPSPLSDVAPRAGAPFAEWLRLAEQMRGGQLNVGLMLVHGANPVYGLPAATGIADAFGKVPFIVSFSSFLDETSAHADLILPDHVGLEAWGNDVPNPGSGAQLVGMQQPVVDSFHDTRDYVDVLLAVARELGGSVQRALPWSSYRDLLREATQQLQSLHRGSVATADAEQFWTGILQKGGWWDERATATVGPVRIAPLELPAQPPQPAFAGSAQEYPFHLVVYPHLSLGTGENAHLPWAQATPDPVTSVAWVTWIEINPETAKELGVHRHDIIKVTSPNGTIEAVVYPYPAIPRDVVAIPLGQGHQFYGRYAAGHGVNPLSILAPMTDTDTGALASGATRVKLARTGRQLEMPDYEGTQFAAELEPGTVVQTTKD